MNYQADLIPTQQLFQRLIDKYATENGTDWVKQKAEAYKQSPANRTFFLMFSAAPRFVGKEPIPFTTEELAEAQALRKGFDLTGWTMDQLVRVYFVLHLPHKDQSAYVQLLNQVFEMADMHELVALYTALPILPHPEALAKRAAEGIRTNMTVVLDAICLNNPYPAEYLDEIAWNQLVLKSVFTERPLYKILGADSRANAHLAHMLSDYAHERWAASRLVTPELWRFTGQFLNESLLQDMKTLVAKEDPHERYAAILACMESSSGLAKDLLKHHQDLVKEVQEKQLDWDRLGAAYEVDKGPLPTGYQQAGSGVSVSDPEA
ncbi:EboA domain-containing protein [Rapidithrix thailandica]|uniref:EboA domain-containing protein n=1 Tax=Rapidithrix thailandica TaxID=413964 RepID=A0AAW9SCN3_9BACT